MNTKNNQRTRLSKILLKNALMDLLGEKGSVAKISVRNYASVPNSTARLFMRTTPSRKICSKRSKTSCSTRLRIT